MTKTVYVIPAGNSIESDGISAKKIADANRQSQLDVLFAENFAGFKRLTLRYCREHDIQIVETGYLSTTDKFLNIFQYEKSRIVQFVDKKEREELEGLLKKAGFRICN